MNASPPPPPVTVSESAAKRIASLMSEENALDGGLRIQVKGGGCSGLTYDLNITGDLVVDDTEKVVEQYGVKVIVEKKSYIYLVGTELDFSDGLNGKGFVFENPNAKKACGCGTSFSV